MAIDIEAIRKKLSQVGQKSGSTQNKYKRWKYEKAGTYKLRVIPFRNTEPGVPFPEKIVYYGIGKGGKGMIVSPENEGHKDPIKDFRIKLFNDAKDLPKAEADELKEMAKKLQAKTMTCVAVVDRSNESMGVQLWTPNWTDSQQLMSLFLTEAGDYTDLSQGRDITLVVSPGKKRNQRTGEQILEAKIQVSFTAGPAASTDAVLKDWLESMPNLNEYYPITSTEETASRLKDWLAGDEDDGSEGTTRGPEKQVASAPPEPQSSSVSESDTSSKKKTVVAKKTTPVLQQTEDDLDRELADMGD